MTLQDRFLQLCFLFTNNQALIQSLWKEIEKKHSEKGRYYHNLSHLENMFQELERVKSNISDFSAISFSVFYHDFMYEATSNSNEEKSAAAAEKRLKEIGLPYDTILTISKQILATKSHQRSEDEDTNYLLDADLSILGKDLETYLVYTNMIRKEYSIYPDFLYKPGRKKVLQHFLELESIFKTEYFKDRYEIQAKNNIAAEIQLL
ncbi:hypothetical protein [Chryseobacterium sp. Bi04]|uniref:HD domain-containing protein n=1 Tax=Chryseobacterium sp. Bi04 TaxID=2822345 RepID=UPI001DE17C4B|nr:hypothetical protein [Chryseobacterium sp. Bi04]CAH0234479.1 hypothetical protein SRABI04_02821 [Chryseobacterium sp. Bi04]